MTTTNMSLNEPSVGVTTGPDWATQVNENFETIDTHDHTSGKGVQLTPSALNINADLEFNQNSATELKNVIFDSSVTAATTSYSVYQSDGNLYWRNGSGTAVQITSGSGINTSGGSISNMTGNAQVQFSNVNKSYTFKFDSTLTDGIAKLVMSDIQLYFYNSGSATTRSVNLKYTGSGTGSNTLTVPDETGTLLSTATSFAGEINIATSSSNAAINLKPNGTGHVVVGNGGASGKLTSNGAYDLVLDTNSGTNSGTITITDGVNGEITLDTNGTGDINLTAGADVNIPPDIGLTFGDDGEKIEGDGTDLTIASSGEINVNSGTLDLSAQTVDVTLNAAVDALNFDSNTLSIDASNNRIGIGLTSPASRLEVGGDTNTVVRIASNSSNGDPSLQLWDRQTTQLGQVKAFQSGGTVEYLSLGTGTNNSLNIKSDGNVGIGTSSPDYSLHLNPSTDTYGLKIQRGPSDYQYLRIGQNGGVSQFVSTGYTTTLGTFTFSGSGTSAPDTLTEYMRIDSSGNVLVGTNGSTSWTNTAGFYVFYQSAVNATRDGNEAINLNRLTSDGDIAIFRKDGTTIGSIGVVSGNAMYMASPSSGNTGFMLLTNQWRPCDNAGNINDNAIDIGQSNARLKDIYATNGTIQTSDRNEKQDIEELSEAEKRVAVAAKGLFRKYRWKSAVAEKADDARIHFGIIAQDLQSAFEAEGLDAGRYAMFIHSEWWETQTEVPAVEAQDAVYETQTDEEGNEVQVLVSEAVEAKESYTRTDTYDTEEEAPEGAVKKDRMGVRYSELLAFIIGAI